jgi:uncharacterized protein YegL
MKTTKTIYQFIVDKSTSMQGSEEQVITGFNMQLDKLKELSKQYPDQSYIASVTYFDCEVQNEISFGAIEEVHPLTMANYQPDGMTALLDAIGEAIDNTQEKYYNELKAKEANVVFIILTDGEENYSTYYTYNLVSSKIKTLEETGDWTFTFIGADFDATEVSHQLNVKPENVISFSKIDFEKRMEFVSCSMEEYETSRIKGNKRANFFSKIIDRVEEKYVN